MILVDTSVITDILTNSPARLGPAQHCAGLPAWLEVAGRDQRGPSATDTLRPFNSRNSGTFITSCDTAGSLGLIGAEILRGRQDRLQAYSIAQSPILVQSGAQERQRQPAGARRSFPRATR